MGIISSVKLAQIVQNIYCQTLRWFQKLAAGSGFCFLTISSTDKSRSLALKSAAQAFLILGHAVFPESLAV